MLSPLLSLKEQYLLLIWIKHIWALKEVSSGHDTSIKTNNIHICVCVCLCVYKNLHTLNLEIFLEIKLTSNLLTKDKLPLTLKVSLGEKGEGRLIFILLTNQNHKKKALLWCVCMRHLRKEMTLKRVQITGNNLSLCGKRK